MIPKAGLGILGLGLIGTGGIALAKPGLLGISHIPDFYPLTEDNDYSSTYNGDGDKFGKKYGEYLVGVTHKKDSANPKQTNEKWWEWAFKRLNQTKIESGKFSNQGNDKKVTSWFSDSVNTALNKVCKAAYETNDQNGNFDEGDTQGNKFKKSEVWKYCSIGGTQPQTIKEFNDGNSSPKESYTTNGLGTTDEQQGKLLSLRSKDNDWVWDLKDKEFQLTEITEEGHFKTGKKDGKWLKQICGDAYNKEESTGAGANKLTKEDVEKYCSLTGTNS